MYFKKWKELFPESKRRTYDAPYIEWHLSEIVAPIVLNDKRMQKFLKQKDYFYKEHTQIKIGKKSAPEYFTDLYNKYINQKNGFEIFLLKAYEKIKENKEKFV